jgi:hypothetical protein
MFTRAGWVGGGFAGVSGAGGRLSLARFATFASEGRRARKKPNPREPRQVAEDVIDFLASEALLPQGERSDFATFPASASGLPHRLARHFSVQATTRLAPPAGRRKPERGGVRRHEPIAFSLSPGTRWSEAQQLNKP